METGPDFELLKDAYAIIDGIPETAIDLDKLQSARGETLERGTVCSPAGWLAQHPAFQERGLSLSNDGSRLLLDNETADESAADASPTQILAQVFRFEQMDAERLFGDRNTYTLGDDSGLSDKRLWLHEVREFLKEHDQLDAAFEERLETRGPFAEPANPSGIRAI